MQFPAFLGVLLIVGVMVNNCSCKIYTAPYEFEKLLAIERKLVSKMMTYTEQQLLNNNVFDTDILNFIIEANDESLAKKNVRDLDTPLTPYHTLRRIVNQWEELKQNMTCNLTIGCPLVTGEDVINKVWKGEHNKPDEKDIQAAALGIINVLNVYGLNLDDLVAGQFHGAEDNPLTADDVFYIADIARQSSKTYEAIALLEYLLSNLKNFPTPKFKVTTLYSRLAMSYHEHGVTRKAVQLLKDFLEKEPGNTKITRDLRYFETRAKKSKLSEVLRFQADDSSKKTEQIKNYERLCQNGAKGEYQTTNLTCQLVPLLNYYGMAKVETLSLKPKIERYHEVLNKTGLATFKGYGNISYERIDSHFPSKQYTQSSPQVMRSGPMCEVNAYIYPFLPKVSGILERTTRFHIKGHGGITSSLCYELNNEGVGGYQNPVIDYRTQKKMTNPKTQFRESGNKVATIILQLSDVSYGGGIAFPRADLYVPVEEGSAVVIWNLKENGLPEPRSIRLNCPVVVGSSWTALKHVFYNNQIFRRPCEAQN